MSYCDCKICNSDGPEPDRPRTIYSVVVKRVDSGYWAVEVGSKWLEIRGTLGMSLKDVREKVFSELDDVRAHPNSRHYDDEFNLHT